MQVWSPSRAQDWWQRRGWVCGANFLPSTAVNFLEMWHPESFDRITIARELGWAAEAGLNALRVNLHSLVWRHDPEGLIQRLDWVMDQAARQGMRVAPCLFDDCGFGGQEPHWGPQPDPLPGVHNSRAVASPGRDVVVAGTERAALESYVRGVVGAFRDDPRVLFWDIYNEPGNRMEFTAEGFAQYPRDLEPAAIALMEMAFGWARAEAPEAPLTAAAWSTPLPGEEAAPYQTEADQRALDLSDIVTFHAYWHSEAVAGFIDHLAARGRPMLCTEWMARAVGSTIPDQLPLFRARDVGCFQWGLVRGRTQTHLPWPADLVAAHGGDPRRDIWFHDLLHPDGRPYDPEEIATIKRLRAAPPGGAQGGAAAG